MIDLIDKLLCKDPNGRPSILEIKNHPWFSNISWDRFKLKKTSPAWIPDMNQSNFDPEFTSLPLDFDEDAAP